MGGQFYATAGMGGPTGPGGTTTVEAGPGGANGDGGTTQFRGGAGGSTSGAGGAVTVQGGTATDGDGGVINITGGTGVGTSRNGGNVNILAGTSTNAISGATADIRAGDGGPTGVGGDAYVTGGNGGSTSGGGGDVYVRGGFPTDGAGGSVFIQGQAGVGTERAGGAVQIVAGNATGTQTGGAVTLTGGGGGGTGGTGGAVTISGGGGGSSAATGGAVAITSGSGGPTGNGATATLQGGSGGATSGPGGDVVVQGGDATDGNGGAANLFGRNATGTNRAGGDVLINAGNSTGTVVGGIVTISGGSGGSTSGDGGAVELIGGTTTATGAVGGAIDIGAGFVVGTGTGGATNIAAGSGGSTAGNGGNLLLEGGGANAGNGGAVSVRGRSGVGTDKSGGNVSLYAGAKTGTGTVGTVRILDSADNTKIAAFDASGITTATTRTFAFDDESGTLITNNTEGFAFPNVIINGNLDVWQMQTTFTSPAAGAHLADMWRYGKAGDMVHTISRSTDVPTVAQAGRLFQYSMLVDCTTADASIATTDYCEVYAHVEGYNFVPLAQRTMRLGFWVKGTKTGIHCVSLINGAGDRSYVAEYTINTTATWEYKEVTIAASPSAGTWSYTTGLGLYVVFTLAAGTNYHTTAGAWQTGNFLATSNQVNACDSTANDFRVTGIFLVPGDLSSEVQMRHRSTEFALCQRYLEMSYDYETFPGATVANGGAAVYNAATSTGGGYTFRFAVKKRVSPTMTTYSNNSGTSGKIYDNANAVDVNSNVYMTGEGSTGAYGAHTSNSLNYTWHWVADARL
jgi:hypothetical protein